ncbi:hypothetical protein [Candidatus Odyssella thessalonicensis]|uniref:hypothetical protein n=1 Tax=Candidatus Odyssella thessalonicensis TaxID=84647 RepID=UPI000225BF72|nr:hypothetical protein [Candidatus Odyssella thessalonicensis]
MKKILALLAIITATVSMETPEDGQWLFKEYQYPEGELIQQSYYGDYPVRQVMRRKFTAENHSKKGYIGDVCLEKPDNKAIFMIVTLKSRSLFEVGEASYAALLSQGNFAQEIQPLGVFVSDTRWRFKSFLGKE